MLQAEQALSLGLLQAQVIHNVGAAFVYRLSGKEAVV